MSRTLCPDQGNQSLTVSGDYFNSASSQEFFVGVSTSNPTNTSFRVHVEKVQNFILSMDSNYTAMVTASEPKYYQFNFPEGVSNVLLSVTSEDDTCMSISIQNLGVCLCVKNFACSKCSILDFRFSARCSIQTETSSTKASGRRWWTRPAWQSM